MAHFIMVLLQVCVQIPTA